MRDDEEYYELDLYLWDQTDKAYQVAKTSDPLDKAFWIPKSLTKGIVKFAPDDNGCRFCRIKLQAWKANELGL